MHVQGGNRGTKVAQPGDVVHEGNHIHEYEVLTAVFHHVVLRHKATGRESEYTEREFNDIFEY